MTPDDAVTAVFKSAIREMGRVPLKPAAYESFLITVSERLDQAAQRFAQIAKARGGEADDETLTMLEHAGLHEIMSATVAAMLALGHYPYLSRIVLDEDRRLV